MEKNKPYIKEWKTIDGKYEVINPITEHEPYLHKSTSTREIRRGTNVVNVDETTARVSLLRRTKSSKRKLGRNNIPNNSWVAA